MPYISLTLPRSRGSARGEHRPSLLLTHVSVVNVKMVKVDGVALASGCPEKCCEAHVVLGLDDYKSGDICNQYQHEIYILFRHQTVNLNIGTHTCECVVFWLVVDGTLAAFVHLG